MIHEVVELQVWVRNKQKTAMGGLCKFRDGKEWKWHISNFNGQFYFTIDSGIPSQWSLGNYGRMIAPPKRVTALKKKMQQEGEL